MAGLKKIPIFTFMAILATLQPSFAQWFKVIASHTPVIAPVGSDADLGCYLVPAGSAESMTIKFHRGDPNSYVYVYNKRLDDTGNQDEEYKGRTEFLTENIGQGQVTVRIKNFQPSDIAFYTCIFASDDHVDFATLELKEAPPADSLTGGQIVGIVAGSIAAAVAAAAVALGWCHFKNRRRDKELAQLRTELKNDLKRERMKELIHKKLKEKLKSKEKTIDSIQGLLQRKEEEQELREFIAEIRDVIAGGEEAQAEMKKELGNLEEQNSGTANEEDTLFLDKQSDEEAKGGVV
uniref:Myelin-oligodendrocyte glycoprotein-like n=1 Tax=Xenopus tropicalis TaxID=8364 RepID=A0A803KBN8_XENTR